MINTKRIFFKNKNFKVAYYLNVFMRELVPSSWSQLSLARKLKRVELADQKLIDDRVNYYNKIHDAAVLSAAAVPIRRFVMPKRTRVYYFDTKEYARHFNRDLYLEMIPGDVVHIPEYPAIVKSRPIAGENRNAVLLNLDKVRHFNFIRDEIPFRNKKDLLIGRMAVYQEHRKRFLQMYFNHPLCDLGDVKKREKSEWYKQPISITKHLAYKFVLSLEGNDVATNLKWIMSSNSIAVMPTPKFETWFMEGRLEADVHYIKIKDDYSDLEERLKYYIESPIEAEKIIAQAHAYVQQFRDRKVEDAIAIKVLQKYFAQTGQ